MAVRSVSARLKGFVKMIADKKTDEILGVHIIVADASDLIAEAVVAMEFRRRRMISAAFAIRIHCCRK